MSDNTRPEIGDYVLAHKWSDADPCDPWAVGFYAGMEGDRHRVTRKDGSPIPNVGSYRFRYVRKISATTGNWLVANSAYLERQGYRPRFARHNLGYWIRAAKTPQCKRAAKGQSQ